MRRMLKTVYGLSSSSDFSVEFYIDPSHWNIRWGHWKHYCHGTHSRCYFCIALFTFFHILRTASSVTSWRHSCAVGLVLV